MRFWFVHSGEVPIREQMVTQIRMGILSEELAPGEKLPSTRELARRFCFHPNTVSAAYRQLESEGWLESRRGSGVFVRPYRSQISKAHRGQSTTQAFDHIFGNFLHSARKLNIPPAELKNRLREWLAAPETTAFLLIEPCEPLQRILLTELRAVIDEPVIAYRPDDPVLLEKLAGAIALVLPSKAASVRAILPAGAELITLQVRSAGSSLAEWLPAPSDALVGVASPWPQFLEIARTMLIAAGFSADALLLRDTSQKAWMAGLEQATAVVCDSYTATQLNSSVRTIPYPLLTDTSLKELQLRAAAMASSVP